MARAMPTHNGPPPKGSTGSEAPSASLYVKNLPDKLQKADLRMSIYMLFATYGPVLDVVAMKTKGMRGQAHVVFRDVQASTQAMRALQGFDFYGKEMSIQYARGRSNVFTKLEGVYRPPNVPTTTSEGQASIFTAPAVTAPISSAPPGAVQALESASNGTKSEDQGAQGVKRRRGDESDEEEAPMEVDDDDDVSMEASSDDDE